MPLIKSILCPVDFSESSVNAYEYAQSLAVHYNATLDLQHVLYSSKAFDFWDIYPDSYEEDCRQLRAVAERKLREFAKSHLLAQIPLQYFVQDGLTADLILSFAETQAANLIVMGTHGLRGIDRLILGSVIERVLRRAHCPVLAVRKPERHVACSVRDLEQVNFKKVLLCTDFSDHARRASEYALSIAEAYGAELTLLHVLEDFPEARNLQTATEKVKKELDESIAAKVCGNCTVNVVVRAGKPYQQIIQLAIEAQTDIVVMGVRGRDALDAALFGSVTHRVIQLGPCPVLAIPI